MIRVRKADERGSSRTGWLESYHAFSFADYYDPLHVQFGSLRVFNDDAVAAGAGFPPHPHRDMEIVSFVVSGAIAHRDSTGGEGVLRAGEVQRMSAGTGVVHSEFNASKSEPLHFLQMWVIPERQGLQPEYEQKGFPPEERKNRLRCVVAPDGRDGALRIHQRAEMLLGSLEADAVIEHRPSMGRRSYVHVIDGIVDVQGQRLHPGDAALLEGEELVRIEGREAAEILVWDLA